MQGQGQKYGQKHETKELVQFHNHLHALTMILAMFHPGCGPSIFSPLQLVAIIYTKCMVPRETVSFVFPRVLMFPETKSRETSGLEGKQN